MCEACETNVLRPERGNGGSRFVEQLASDAAAVLASLPPQVLTAGATVAEAVDSMRESGAGYVLVADDGRILGIFTERDLLRRVIAAGRAPADTAIESVMTPDPVVLRQDDSLAIAINKMVMGDFRHIPLVDASGRVRGVTSSHDLLRHLHTLMHNSDD
jgi:CBS domain-containing protein